MAGETEQLKGREGALLAKKWLERTTRVKVPWVNPDEVAVPKLTFDKVHQENNSNSFSFDFGGHFRGEEIDGQQFLAECKTYKSSQDQGTHYSEFLAKCYRVVSLNNPFSDNFLWVSFAPFNVTVWDKQTGEEAVRKAVIKERAINFGPEQNPETEIDDEIVKKFRSGYGS
ncbi:hypothetical protein ACYAFX_16530 [Rhodococcus aetherivorans]